MSSDGNQPIDASETTEPSSASEVPAPSDALTTEAVALLEQPVAEKTWVHNLGLLVLSLVVFVASGLLNSSVTDLLLLVGVLAFHEFGHYLGMRLFNYRDVRMFFVPFLGAAVSGRPTAVAGYKEAIVILLGPVPGIVLGIAVGFACFHYEHELLRPAARMLLLINGFNLLPFLPLDGGRLLQLVLFSRQRHLEALFRVLTGGALAVYGRGIDAWLLAAMGFFMIVSTGQTFRVSTLAQRLRRSTDATEQEEWSAGIPTHQALTIVAAVRDAIPKMTGPNALANTARQVWERMHVRPPGIVASALLLAFYAASFFAVPVALFLFHRPIAADVTHTAPDGRTSSVEETRVWGQLQSKAELNFLGNYDGRFQEFALPSGRVIVEGTFVDGQAAGTWSFFDPLGRRQGTLEVENGVVVKQEGQIPAKYR